MKINDLSPMQSIFVGNLIIVGLIIATALVLLILP